MTKRLTLIKYHKEFIADYIGDDSKAPPGEHHFVGCYLLPLILASDLNLGHPDYLNLDGSKNKKAKTIIGDLAWETEFATEQGKQIEVKIKYKAGMVFSNFTKAQKRHVDKHKNKENPLAYVLVSLDGVLICSASDIINMLAKDEERSKNWKEERDYYSIDFSKAKQKLIPFDGHDSDSKIIEAIKDIWGFKRS